MIGSTHFTQLAKVNFYTEYIEFRYSGSLVKEVHMNPGNHSQIYFTLHFQPSRMIYDPGSPGGELIFLLSFDF